MALMSVFEICCNCFEDGMTVDDVMRVYPLFRRKTVLDYWRRYMDGSRPKVLKNPRRIKYFELFDRGFLVDEVAEIMGVAVQTAYAHRGRWEDAKLAELQKARKDKNKRMKTHRIRDTGGVVFDRLTRTDTIWRTA